MRELLLRHAGPAIVVVFEVEAPTRITSTAGHHDRLRLDSWIEESEARSAAVAWAAADRERMGGPAREAAWLRELRGDPGGVVEALEAVLRGDYRP